MDKEVKTKGRHIMIKNFIRRSGNRFVEDTIILIYSYRQSANDVKLKSRLRPPVWTTQYNQEPKVKNPLKLI